MEGGILLVFGFGIGLMAAAMDPRRTTWFNPPDVDDHILHFRAFGNHRHGHL